MMDTPKKTTMVERLHTTLNALEDVQREIKIAHLTHDDLLIESAYASQAMAQRRMRGAIMDIVTILGLDYAMQRDDIRLIQLQIEGLLIEIKPVLPIEDRLVK